MAYFFPFSRRAWRIFLLQAFWRPLSSARIPFSRRAREQWFRRAALRPERAADRANAQGEPRRLLKGPGDRAAGLQGCNALGAESFTPSRLRLASSRLRFSPWSTIRAVLSAASLSRVARSPLVLCDSSDQASTTVSFWSASFAEGAERSEEHLFGQRVAIVARLGSVDRAAMTPQRRTNRTDARAAGALLPPELAARAADFALILGLVRARAEAGEIPARSFVQQILVNLRAENGIRQLERADFLATQIYHIHHRHNFCPWSSNYFAFLPA